MTKAANGSGHIRRRVIAGGAERFDVLIRDEGKQITLKGGLLTRADATAYLAQWLHKKRLAGKDVPLKAQGMTVRQLGVVYLAAMNAKTLETEESRWNARVLTSSFADTPLTQLNDKTVRAWVNEMARTPIEGGKSAGQLPSRGTLSTALSCLRRALRWAVIEGHIDRNVALDVKIRDSTTAARKGTRAGEGFDYLREDEVRRILESDALPQRQRTAFTMLAFTGARPMDLYLLTWDRVDIAGSTVAYHSHKRDRDYVVHMLPQALEVLRTWWMKCGRPKRGLVFAGPDGKPHVRGYDFGWSGTRGVKTWRKTNRAGVDVKYTSKKGVTEHAGYRQKMGIERPLPLYSLRHTCASHLLLGTAMFTGGRRWSLEEVASQLGHADLTTVRRYAVSLGLASKSAVEESRAALKAQKAGSE